MNKQPIPLLALALLATACTAQQTDTMSQAKTTNPLLCDTTTGLCEMPGNANATSTPTPAGTKPVKVVYFTDPICSSCWGIEPQLRRMAAEYGDVVEVEYRMGGLLPDWSYNSGGISSPADVAHHWDEVSLHYDMPIDGDLWLEDPLESSYPPSIAFKAAQLQDAGKASVFMREMRERVFLKKQNIAKWDVIEAAAKASGLDSERMQKDIAGPAKELFRADLELGRKLGVRGFPTLFFSNAQGEQHMVYGSKPYPVFEGAVLGMFPTATKHDYPTAMDALFKRYPTLTAKEYSVLSGVARQTAEQQLEQAVASKKLAATRTKNGTMYAAVAGH